MASKPTFGEINQKYWDSQAETAFSQEWIQNIMRQVLENLQSHIDWIGIKQKTATKGAASQDASVRMLDYACGSGMASRALFPHVSEIRGIDVSDGMVEQYNKSARDHGVPESQMYAIQGDLTAPLIDKRLQSLGSEFFGFDVIVISMALHHINTPDLLTKRLVERLSEGGVLVIIDWTLNQEDHQPQNPGEESHSHREHHQPQKPGEQSHNHAPHGGHGQHSASHTVAHEGFSKEQMANMLREAGCNEVDYFVLDEPTKVPFGRGQKQLFFARGKK